MIVRRIRVLLGAAAVALIGLLWFVLQMFPIGGSGKLVIVTVHPGDSVATIASEMHQQGVLASPLAFRIDDLIFGSILIRPGSYQIAQGASFSQVRSVFGNLPNVRAVSVMPGMTFHEVALQVSGQKGVSFADTFASLGSSGVVKSPFQGNGATSLEGLIGTGEYIIDPGETPLQLLQSMVTRFNSQAASVGLTPSTTESYKTGRTINAYQIITAASIVEKEGYYPSNMPQVARVILNRLARGGGLQMDATVLYYLGQDGGKVTPAMLRLHSPYNTYYASGLTPTPICSVSLTALKAMLHPPVGSWLYFVVIDKNGTEAFSSTFAQQLANERLAASRGL